MRRVLLAAVGDPNDAATFGGTPFHFLEAATALEVVDAGLPLDATAAKWKRRRVLWNIRRLISYGEWGGYQFSKHFLDKLWQEISLEPSDVVISFSSLLPEKIFQRHGDQILFYVDQCLADLFEVYGLARAIGRKAITDALARERAQLAGCRAVVCRSAWAAESIRQRYSLPSSKVHVAVGGANIRRDALEAFDAAHTDQPPSRHPGPLRIVFVGKEWQRKGLDRLIRAQKLLHARNVATRLLVIGIDRASLPAEVTNAPGVVFAGFIDKNTDSDRFIDLVASSDLGCLPSRAEASARSVSEFCRLGLPVVVPEAGGSIEQAACSMTTLTVSRNASDSKIADLLYGLATDEARLLSLRAQAWKARHVASWDNAVRVFAPLVGREVKASAAP